MCTPSKITPHQTRTYGPVPALGRKIGAVLTAIVRFDDRYNNGSNQLSVTAVVTSATGESLAAGCLHDEISACFPELAPLLKWHLCSTIGPLHYVENTMFWLGRRGYTRWDYARADPNDPPDLARARQCALWPDMPADFVVTGTRTSNDVIEAVLTARLPALLAEFRAAIESLGMTW